MSHPLARVPNAALLLEWLIGQGAMSFWRETRLTLACFWGCWGRLSISASHRYLARVSGKPACSMVNLANTNRCWFRRSVFRWSLAIRQTATLINFIQTAINRYYQQIFILGHSVIFKVYSWSTVQITVTEFLTTARSIKLSVTQNKKNILMIINSQHPKNTELKKAPSLLCAIHIKIKKIKHFIK